MLNQFHQRRCSNVVDSRLQTSSIAFVSRRDIRRHSLSIQPVERKHSLQDVQGINFNDNNNTDETDGIDSNTATNNGAMLDVLPSTLTMSHNFWINIGSVITSESCPLLGIKSLGVDYGLARTGLAMTVGYEPIPLGIITSHNVTELCQIIVKFATTNQVQQIIVGLPLHKNGTVAEQTMITYNFTHQLAMTVVSYLGPKIKILLFDERYTSKMAAAREHTKNPSSHLYGTLDATAACIILENYYEDHGIGAHIVTLPKNIQEECVQQYIERQTTIDQQRIQQINDETNKRKRRLELIAHTKLLDQQLCDDNHDTKKKRKKKKRK
jgi:putative holliday junction resolvase